MAQEVERWKKRIDACDQLLQTLERNREDEIAAAWQRLQQLGGHPDAERWRQRAELAVERNEALTRLAGLPTHLPADEQDRLLLPVWEKVEDVLRDCPEAEEWRQRCEKARERLRSWDELETAVERQDLTRLAEAAANPLLQDYPPFVQQAAHIRELSERGPRVRRILENLALGSQRTFDDPEDLECLRTTPALFEPQQQALTCRTWDIADLRLSPLNPALALLPPGRAIRIRWSWSASRRVHVCLLAVEKTGFLEVPWQTRSLIRVEEADYRRGGGGFLIPAPQGGGDVYVTLWPILDLGWVQMTGSPLHLGPLRMPGGSGRSPSGSAPSPLGRSG
jgi:hypothetical protein